MCLEWDLVWVTPQIAPSRKKSLWHPGGVSSNAKSRIVRTNHISGNRALIPSITARNILSYKFANMSYNVFVPAWGLLCQWQKTWFHREKLRRCSLPHQIPCIRFVAGKDFNWYKWALYSPLSSSMAINIHIISENPSWFWWSKANCHLSKSSLPAPGDGKMGHGEQTFWWEASSWWLLRWK